MQLLFFAFSTGKRGTVCEWVREVEPAPSRAVRGLMTDKPATTKRDRWVSALILALGLFVLASPQYYRDDFHSANEASRIYAAIAIVDHGTLHIDPVFDQYFPGWRTREQPPNEDLALKDGHYLLDKAPGVTLLSVPVLAGLRLFAIETPYSYLAWALSLLFAALPSLLFMVLLARWLRGAFGADTVGELVAPALVLASPWLLFSAQLFGHALAASLVGAGTLLALGPLNADQADRHRIRDALLGGLCLGVAVLAEYSAVFLAIAVCVAAVVDTNGRKRLLWVVLGGLGPAAVLLTWNTVAFGGPLAFSYGFKWNPVMAATHGEGLYGFSWPTAEGLRGLFLSSSRGLFFLAPWLVITIPGAFWFCRDRLLSRSWRAAVFLGAVVVPLVISGLGGWYGGRTLGPRYLLICLPVFGISAAMAVHHFAQWRMARWVLAPLAGLVLSSFVLNLAGHMGFPYVSFDVANPLFEVVLPVLFVGGPCPTVWSPLLGSYGAGLLLLACPVLIGLYLWRTKSGIAAIDRKTTGHGTRAPSRMIPVALLVTALALHLTAGTVPTTADGNRIVRQERLFAHELQCNPETTPRHCEAFEALLRQVRGDPQ